MPENFLVFKKDGSKRTFAESAQMYRDSYGSEDPLSKLSDDEIVGSLVEHYPDQYHIEKTEDPTTFAGRAARSFGKLAKDTATAPFAIAKAANSVLQSKTGGEAYEKLRAIGSAVSEDYKSAYGGTDRMLNTLSNDPARVLSDVAMLATIGGGSAMALSKVGRFGRLANTGKAALAAGDWIDPIGGAARATRLATLPLTSRFGEGIYKHLLLREAPSNMPGEVMAAAEQRGWKERIPVSPEGASTVSSELTSSKAVRSATSAAADANNYFVNMQEVLDPIGDFIDSMHGGDLMKRKQIAADRASRFAQEQSSNATNINASGLLARPSEKYTVFDDTTKKIVAEFKREDAANNYITGAKNPNLRIKQPELNPLPPAGHEMVQLEKPHEMTHGESEAYRKSENIELRDAYWQAQQDVNLGKDVKVRKMLNDVLREKHYAGLEKFDQDYRALTGRTFTETNFGRTVDFSAMGKRDKELFDVAELIDRATNVLMGKNPMGEASPYYMSQTARTLTAPVTGRPAGILSGFVASIGTIKALYTWRPDLASRLAFALADGVSKQPSVLRALRTLVTSSGRERTEPSRDNVLVLKDVKPGQIVLNRQVGDPAATTQTENATVDKPKEWQ